MLKKQFISHGVFGILVAFLLAAAACSKDEKSPTGAESTTTVQLTISGLKRLENGLNYQAWAIEYVDGYYYGYALGLFNFNENGKMVDVSGDTLLSGEFTVGLASDNIYGIAITIELSDVMVSYSSSAHILGGEVSEGQANLTIDNWMGMETSFASVSGRYILATPTDSINTNEKSGIWFMDLSSGISLNGLGLPELPSGWEYEGWVILNSTYLSTGKFTSVNTTDGSSNYSGTWSSPTFPGEDFLQNAPAGLSFPIDLAGASVMITVEPWNGLDDNTDKPFFLKLLAADIPVSAVDHTTYYMSAVTVPMPSGTATLK
ncbi:MAG TPA: hypothetical protein VM123_15055 [archaeon]|nr:hypothetical protein [archaeon]